MSDGYLYGRRWWPAAELATHLLEKRTTYARGGHLLWTGARNDEGYPYVSVGGRMTGAHRLIYAALRGPLVPGEPVHHTCAIRLCVAPTHLQAATTAENGLEALARRGLEARLAVAHEWLADELGGLMAADDLAEAVVDRLELMTARAGALTAALEALDPHHPLLLTQ